MSEETYDKLRAEWQEKILNLQIKIEEMEFDVSTYLDDLEIALALMSNLSILYERKIISHKLNPPFSYLSTLIEDFSRQNGDGFRSEQITSGVAESIK